MMMRERMKPHVLRRDLGEGRERFAWLPFSDARGVEEVGCRSLLFFPSWEVAADMIGHVCAPEYEAVPVSAEDVAAICRDHGFEYVMFWVAEPFDIDIYSPDQIYLLYEVG
jgi:hypothetical protein